MEYFNLPFYWVSCFLSLHHLFYPIILYLCSCKDADALLHPGEATTRLSLISTTISISRNCQSVSILARSYLLPFFSSLRLRLSPPRTRNRHSPHVRIMSGRVSYPYTWNNSKKNSPIPWRGEIVLSRISKNGRRSLVRKFSSA